MDGWTDMNVNSYFPHNSKITLSAYSRDEANGPYKYRGAASFKITQ